MSNFTQVSYWEQDILCKPYDLIVIGAGITGLMSALFYKRQNPHHRVVILEKDLIPQGASTRNAGFACIGSIGEHMEDFNKANENHITSRIQRRHAGLELLRKTLGDKAIGYNPCGGYELFTSAEAFEAATEKISWYNRKIKELLDEEEVYKAQQLQGYSVIYNRLEGALHPGKLIQQLIKHVQASGVDIKWNTPVKSIGHDGLVNLHHQPSLKAQKVLLAANAFTSNLVPEIDVTPGRGYIFITNRLKNMPWRGTFHHDQGFIYFRNVGSRLLIGGARNTAFEEEETQSFGINKRIKNYLAHFVSDTLKLSDWEVHREWSGIMGFTKTKTPVIKQLDRHRYVAAGLSGMGIAIGSSIGKEAADLLT